MPDLYAIYLRKSRKDLEAEASGQSDTLVRHESALLTVAKAQGLTIGKIYREVVSGDTIAGRPQMQRLLADVQEGKWLGVLVVEVERLARGDTIDQGIVAQTFQVTGTKIITPQKIYDPQNEFDQEYFEFGLYMSRREYLTIKRRLLAGKAASAKEGKYLGSVPPYGYRRVKIPDGKGWTLELHPEQAPVVKQLFTWLVDGAPDESGFLHRLGMHAIATKLNNMGIIPAKGGLWQYSSVTKLVKNPVYMGKIRYRWRKEKKSMKDGKVHVSTPINLDGDIILVQGLHPAIVPEALFYAAQESIKRHDISHVHSNKVLSNPLAGLVFCAQCGSAMQRRIATRKDGAAVLSCKHQFCDTACSSLASVETRMLRLLENWAHTIELDFDDDISPSPNDDLLTSAIASSEKKIAQLTAQLAKAHDLLEQEVYDIDTFVERSQTLKEQIKEGSERLSAFRAQLSGTQSGAMIRGIILPKVKNLLDIYYSLPDATTKNELLKELIDHCEYTKKNRGKESVDDFELVIFPRIDSLS
ncbi:MAG: recombinase family protein [Oscillospiraceae bacterium]|jgi:DNA invertase Pin-like site-specific DNA recombinase|nr:recombinase family protein [Oscillospiraceae bacterium]